MTFGDLLVGDAVFFDANTLICHFEPHGQYGPPCTALIQRVELQELVGFSSTHVLSEVAHRLMCLEGMKRFGWPVAGIAQRMRKHSAAVQQLIDFRQALESIPKLGIQLLQIAPLMVATAAARQPADGLAK